MKKTMFFLTIATLMSIATSGSTYAAVGDVWDVKTDWVDGLDQSTNPNTPWTYHHGVTGDLLVWAENGQWGINIPMYKQSLDFESEGLLLGKDHTFGADGMDPGDFGGHGPWMVRWTSPVAGQIEVDAYIYGTQDLNRLTQWKVIQNGSTELEGFIPYDTNAGTALMGPDNKAMINIVLDVMAGDTVDLYAGPNGWGQVPPPEQGAPSPAPQWCAGGFTITEVPEPATMALLGLGSLLVARRRRK